MGFVALKCPNCGASVDLDESREFCFCTYCGTKVVQDKIIVEHRGKISVDGISTKKNILERANNFLKQGDFEQATVYYNKVLDIEPQMADCYWKLMLCRLKVKNDSQLIQKYECFDNPINLKDYSEFKNAMRYADAEKRDKYIEIQKQLDLSEIAETIESIKNKNLFLITIILILVFFSCCALISGEMTFWAILCLVIAIVNSIIIVKHDKQRLKEVMTPEQFEKFKYYEIYKKL